MAFVVRAVAIRDGGKERLQQTQHPVHVAAHQGTGQIDHRGIGRLCVTCHIIRYEAAHQAYPHFRIRDVQRIDLEHLIISLDGDIAALVQQGGDALHPFGRCVEIGRHSLVASYPGGQYTEFVQHFDEVCGRAAAEPIGVQPPVGESIQQAERVVDVGRGPCEMVTVVMVF